MRDEPGAGGGSGSGEMRVEDVLEVPAVDAFPAARDVPKGIVRDYFETIVICVIFVIFARAFVFQQSKIPTGSMIPTLLIGDYIMVNKFVYSPASTPLGRSLLPVREIRRGDIIVFKFPEEPEKDYIKRVIGLPGEFIEIKNKTVYINGVPLVEPYKIHETDLTPESWTKIKEGEAPLSAAQPAQRRWVYREHEFEFKQMLIPEDSYFCMGDNRDNSKDSRSWGTVPRANVKGKAFIIWWSFSGEEGDYVKTSVLERVKSIVNKLTHFFAKSKSRYRRCLHFIT
jgi:signal peptidase I